MLSAARICIQVVSILSREGYLSGLLRHFVKRGISFGVVETWQKQKSAKMLFANCSRLNAGALLVSQTS